MAARLEITTNDTSAARAFNEGPLGWIAQGDPDVYSMFQLAEGGIPGGVRSAYLRDLDGNLFSIYRFDSPETASA